MDLGSQLATWGETWPYIAVVVVILSVAVLIPPSNWREWIGAILIEVFIISLFAEMYGFPLTAYLVTGLPLDTPLPHSTGHLWAAFLGLGVVGDIVETALAYTAIIVGALLIIRGWVKVFFADGALVTDGVFGLVRHPQYAGVVLVMIGELIHWPTINGLILFPIITSVYYRIARWEEVHLTKQFGASYLDYRRRLPMFILRWNDVRFFLSAS